MRMRIRPEDNYSHKKWNNYYSIILIMSCRKQSNNTSKTRTSLAYQRKVDLELLGAGALLVLDCLVLELPLPLLVGPCVAHVTLWSSGNETRYTSGKGCM